MDGSRLASKVRALTGVLAGLPLVPPAERRDLLRRIVARVLDADRLSSIRSSAFRFDGTGVARGRRAVLAADAVMDLANRLLRGADEPAERAAKMPTDEELRDLVFSDSALRRLKVDPMLLRDLDRARLVARLVLYETADPDSMLYGKTPEEIEDRLFYEQTLLSGEDPDDPLFTFRKIFDRMEVPDEAARAAPRPAILPRLAEGDSAVAGAAPGLVRAAEESPTRARVLVLGGGASSVVSGGGEAEAGGVVAPLRTSEAELAQLRALVRGLAMLRDPKSPVAVAMRTEDGWPAPWVYLREDPEPARTREALARLAAAGREAPRVNATLAEALDTVVLGLSAVQRYLDAVVLPAVGEFE